MKTNKSLWTLKNLKVFAIVGIAAITIGQSLNLIKDYLKFTQSQTIFMAVLIILSTMWGTYAEWIFKYLQRKIR